MRSQRPSRAAGLLLASVTLLAGCFAGREAKKGDAVMKLVPATLQVTRPKPGDPRVAKIRVYADPGMQALPHWKDNIAEELDYANQLLTPLLGVRMQVDGAIREWPRDGDAHQALRQLQEHDKADDAVWVIGYVAPADRQTSAMAELGDAEPLGHHVIVRGWDDKLEVLALAGKLPDAASGDRAEVIAAHRRHKQTVVLLHQLAVTLGAIDEGDPTWIQHALYGPKQNTFANRTRELLQLAIDGRLGGEADAALAKRLVNDIEKLEWGGWVPASHDQVIKALVHITETAKPTKTFAGMPPGAVDEVARITNLIKQGRPEEALVELDNLLTAYPATAPLFELKCELMLTKPGVTDQATRAACARVAELAPGDPTVHLAVGEALVRAKDLAGARGELVAAEAKIANLPTGGPAADAWRKLVGIYAAMGALTWTEDALGKSGLDDKPTAATIARTRARYGVPRGNKFVAPDQEAALVDATRGVLDRVYASKFGEAERLLARAEGKWRGSPGLTAARCDLAFRMGQIDAARAACARAVAADPDESWALYLQGVLLLRDTGSTPAGIDKLKKAIAIDPDLGQAWRTLGKAYARGQDRAALDALNAQYQAKFGQALQ
ncbi:MAG TPA: tetratricopeptide repeat protein [Kofleriaceae bacterium]